MFRFFFLEECNNASHFASSNKLIESKFEEGIVLA